MSSGTSSSEGASDPDAGDTDAEGALISQKMGADGVTTTTRLPGGGTKTMKIGADGVTTTIHNKDGTTSIVAGSHDGDTASTTTLAPGENANWVGYNSHHGWNPGAPWWLVLVGMLLLANIVRTAIRARHGDFRTNRQRRRDERAGKPITDLGTARENELLAAENTALKAQATRLEERVAVLERIVTDPARRVAEEIEALR